MASLSFEDDMDLDAYKFAVHKPESLFDIDMKTVELNTMVNWIGPELCLEPCKPVETAPTSAAKKCSKKKETKMRYYDEYNDEYVDSLPSQSDESQKRAYLEIRVRDIEDTLLHDARKTYGLVDDGSPTTPTELVKRIQDGKFVIPKEYADKPLYDPARYIKWRDPDLKEDMEGFQGFQDRLHKEVTKTRDVVKIADPADGLKAIQSLEQFQ